MKKLVLVLTLMTIIFAGCKISEQTPTLKVEEYMNLYQSLDSKVTNKLDDYTDKYMPDLTEDQKKEYITLLKRQYQNLEYKITDENIDEDYATVEVEIKVFDYRNQNLEAEKYIEKNKSKFLNEDNSLNQEKYNNYKITSMKKTQDKKKYNIVFSLHKEKDTWYLDTPKAMDMEKLHGLYQD